MDDPIALDTDVQLPAEVVEVSTEETVETVDEVVETA